MPPSSIWAPDPSHVTRPNDPFRLPPVPGTTASPHPRASPIPLPARTGPARWRIPAAVQRPRPIPGYACPCGSTRAKQRLQPRGCTMTDTLIDRNPEILGGTPVFAGTRVPVRILMEHLEAGDRLDDFLVDYPTVSRHQAVAVLERATTMLVSGGDEAAA